MNKVASQAPEAPIYSSGSLGAATDQLEAALDDLNGQLCQLESALYPVMGNAFKAGEGGKGERLTAAAPAVDRIEILAERASSLIDKVVVLRGSLSLV